MNLPRKKKLRKKLKEKLKAELSSESLILSAKEHIGKFIDRLTIKDMRRGLATAFCAWIGSEAGAAIDDTLQARLVGAGTGILGFELAMCPAGGTPPITQIAGCALLANLGLLTVAPIIPEPYAGALETVSPIFALARALTEDQFAALRAVSPLATVLSLTDIESSGKGKPRQPVWRRGG